MVWFMTLHLICRSYAEAWLLTLLPPPPHAEAWLLSVQLSHQLVCPAVAVAEPLALLIGHIKRQTHRVSAVIRFAHAPRVKQILGRL